MGRNDVQEILDDAKTEIGFTLVDWNCNPRLVHSPLSKHLQGKYKIKRPADLSIVKRLGLNPRHLEHPTYNSGTRTLF